MEYKLDTNMKRKITTIVLALIAWEYGIRELFGIEVLALRNITLWSGVTLMTVIALLAIAGAYWMYNRDI